MSYYWLFLLCPISYMIGNINFSVIFSRFLKSDIRQSGSGNPGATNMLRKFGFKWGATILLLDMIKGALPSLMGLLVFGINTEAGRIALFACGLSTILGHCWPVIFKFKGGKGVATTVGVFFVAHPIVGAIALAVGMIYGIIFEYASISSFITVTGTILWEGFMENPGPTISILLMVIYFIILFTHRKNIWKLLSGNENRAVLLAKLRKKKIKRKQDQWLAEINNIQK